MANYCWNNVIIRGDNDAIDKIEKVFETYPDHSGSFTEWGNEFFKDFPEFATDPFFKNLEDFYKYGTKWWDFTIIRDYTGVSESLGLTSQLSIDGDSAWSPPLMLLEKIAEHYNVRCEISYSEPGCDFAGKNIWQGDECEESYETTYRQFVYDEDGINNLWDDLFGDENYILECKSFDEFVNNIGIENISEEDLDNLEEEFNAMRPPILNKEKTLEDLQEIINHLSNLSMERLSEKVLNIKIALSNEWSKEEVEHKE